MRLSKNSVFSTEKKKKIGSHRSTDSPRVIYEHLTNEEGDWIKTDRHPLSKRFNNSYIRNTLEKTYSVKIREVPSIFEQNPWYIYNRKGK